MTSMATQNNPDVPGGVARVRVTASFRYGDTLIARGIDVRNWHMADDVLGLIPVRCLADSGLVEARATSGSISRPKSSGKFGAVRARSSRTFAISSWRRGSLASDAHSGLAQGRTSDVTPASILSDGRSGRCP
jgi:hypothetical protein